MSLSWEQSKQDPVKLYNNVLKIVTFVYKAASRMSFQHIVWSGEDSDRIQRCH